MSKKITLELKKILGLLDQREVELYYNMQKYYQPNLKWVGRKPKLLNQTRYRNYTYQ